MELAWTDFSERIGKSATSFVPPECATKKSGVFAEFILWGVMYFCSPWLLYLEPPWGAANCERQDLSIRLKNSTSLLPFLASQPTDSTIKITTETVTIINNGGGCSEHVLLDRLCSVATAKQNRVPRASNRLRGAAKALLLTLQQQVDDDDDDEGNFTGFAGSNTNSSVKKILKKFIAGRGISRVVDIGSGAGEFLANLLGEYRIA